MEMLVSYANTRLLHCLLYKCTVYFTLFANLAVIVSDRRASK